MDAILQSSLYYNKQDFELKREMFSFQIRNKNSKRTCPSKLEVTLLLYDTIILLA